jgi:hypothetical protein
VADDVFAADDFWWKRTEEVEAPSLLGGVFAAIYEYVLRPILQALGKLLDAILEWLWSLFGEGPAGDWSSGIPWLWIVVALLAAIVLWRIVVMFRQPREVTAELPPDTPVDELPQAGQLLDEAQAALARGVRRDAIRLAFLALIAHLQDRGRLSWDPSRSNREYQRDLRPWPDVSAGFRACADPYERCWYGGRLPESSDVDSVISYCRQQLQATAGDG